MAGITAGSIYYRVEFDRNSLRAIKAESARIGQELEAAISKGVNTKGISKPVVDALKEVQKASSDVKGPKLDTKSLDESIKTAKDAAAEFKRLSDEQRAGIITQEEYARAAEALKARTSDLLDETKRGTAEYDRLTNVVARSAQAMERMARTNLNDQIKALNNETFALRSQFERGNISQEDFRKRMNEIADAATELTEAMVKTHGEAARGTSEYRAASNALGGAQRGLFAMEGQISKLGMSQQLQIGTQKMMNRQLQALGPIGVAVNQMLTMMQARYAATGAAASSGSLGINAFNASAMRTTGILTTGLVVGAVAGTAALMRLAKGAVDWAEGLDAATYRTGLQAEALQEMEYAARATNTPLSVLHTTLQRIQRRAADADAGNQGLNDTFEKLGVTLRDRVTGELLGTEELLEQVADGLMSIPNETERMLYGFKIFDTEFGRLMPLLSRGSAGIAELRQEARDMGLVISSDGVQSLIDYGSEIQLVQDRMSALTRGLVVETMPVLRDDVIPFIENTAIPVLSRLADAGGAVARLLGRGAGSAAREAGIEFTAFTTTTIGLNAALRLLLNLLGASHPVLRIITLAVSGATAAWALWGGRAKDAHDELNEGIASTRDALASGDGASLLDGLDRVIAHTDGPVRDSLIDLRAEFERTGEMGVEMANDIHAALVEAEAAPLRAQLTALEAAEHAIRQNLQSLEGPEAALTALEDARATAQAIMDAGGEIDAQLSQQIFMLEAKAAGLYENEAENARLRASTEEQLTENLARQLEVRAELDALTSAAGPMHPDVRDDADAVDDMVASIATLRAEQQALNEELQHLPDLPETAARRAEILRELAELDERIKQLSGSTTAAREARGTARDPLVEEINSINTSVSLLRAEFDQELVTRDEYRAGLEEHLNAVDQLLLAAESQAQRQAALAARGSILAGLTATADDPLEPARAWVERLSLDVEFGMKTAGDAISLLRPRLAELEESLASLHAAGESNTDEFSLMQQQADILRAGIAALGSEVDDVNLGLVFAGVDFALPAQDSSPVLAIIEGYEQGVLRLADAHASLTGTTEDTRAAYASALDMFEFVFSSLEEGTDDWYAMAAAIVSARRELERIDDELGTLTASDRIGQMFASVREFVTGLEVPAGLTDLGESLLGVLDVQQQLVSAERVASALGLEFDPVAEEARILTSVLTDLAGRYDSLNAVEKMQLASGRLRLEQLNEILAAREEEAEATREQEQAAKALEAALDDLYNRTTDVTGGVSGLAQLQREVGAAFSETLSPAERYQQMLDDLLTANPDLIEHAEIIDGIQASIDAISAREARSELDQLTASIRSVSAPPSDPLDEYRAALEAMTQSGEHDVDQLAQAWLELELAQARVAEESAFDLAGALGDLERELATTAAVAAALGEEHDLAGKQADLHRQTIELLIPVLGAESEIVQQLIEDWQRLRAEQEATDEATSKTTFGIEDLAASLKSVGSQAGGPMGDFLSGIGETIDLVMQFGTDPIGAVTNLVGSIISGFTAAADAQRKATQQMEADIERLQSSYDLIDMSSFIEQATKTKREQVGRFLFFPIYANVEVLDESEIAVELAVAGAIQSGVSSGFDAAKDIAMRGGSAEDIAEHVKGGLKQAVQDAVWEGVVAAAVTQGAMAELLAELVQAIADGNHEEANRLIAEINGEIDNISETITTGIEGVVMTAAEMHAELVASISEGLQTGLESGMRDAKDVILAGGSREEVLEALTNGLKEAVMTQILDGMIEAALQSAAIDGIVEDIAEAVAAGDWDLVEELLGDADEALDELADDLDRVFGRFADDADAAAAAWREQLRSIGDALQSGLASGARAARDAILAGGTSDDVAAAITGSLRQSVLDQILEGVLAAALAEGALADLTDAIARAIAEGDYDLARELLEGADDAIAEFTEGLDGVFSPFADNLGRAIGDSIQSSVTSGLEAAVRDYMDHGNLREFTDDVERTLYTSVSNALIAAIVEQALAKTIIEQGIADIAEAIASGDNARAAELTQHVMAIVPELARALQPVMNMVRDMAPASVRRARQPAPTRPEPQRGGGIQVAEITGPSRDILVDLLSPLRGLDGLLGVQLRQLEVQEAIFATLTGPLPASAFELGPAPVFAGPGATSEGSVTISHTHNYNLGGDADGGDSSFDTPEFRTRIEEVVNEFTARDLRRVGRRGGN